MKRFPRVSVPSFDDLMACRDRLDNPRALSVDERAFLKRIVDLLLDAHTVAQKNRRGDYGPPAVAVREATLRCIAGVGTPEDLATLKRCVQWVARHQEHGATA